jgi:catechol 2,3-dioxygenase-like lactoylglutathione lyase family enzyme
MSKKSSPLFEGIDTVIIRVSNYLVSKKWYKDKLGMEVIFEDHTSKLVVFDTGSPTSLTIWQTDEKTAPQKERNAYPIFRTSDAAASRTELANKDVNVDELVEAEGIKFYRFYDPDGNLFEACEVLEE